MKPEGEMKETNPGKENPPVTHSESSCFDPLRYRQPLDARKENKEDAKRLEKVKQLENAEKRRRKHQEEEKWKEQITEDQEIMKLKRDETERQIRRTKYNEEQRREQEQITLRQKSMEDARRARKEREKDWKAEIREQEQIKTFKKWKSLRRYAIARSLAIQKTKRLNMRKTSIIVHGVEESTATDRAQRNKEDRDCIRNILHEMSCDTVNVNQVIRLQGKRPAKPKPIKVVFETEILRNKVLSCAKYLKNKKKGEFNKIFMHENLTPRELRARKLLTAELRDRRADGEQNLTIFNGEIVVKHRQQ